MRMERDSVGDPLTADIIILSTGFKPVSLQTDAVTEQLGH